MEFEFDPAKAVVNERKHGVSFVHAEQALHDDRAVTVEDPDAKDEQRQITLGMDALGRVIVVVHTLRGNCVHVISARKASSGEVRNYYA
jgi:uncharacterized DUF497 family protein